MLIKIALTMFAWLVTATALGILLGKSIAAGGIRVAHEKTGEDDSLLNLISRTQRNAGVAPSWSPGDVSSTKETLSVKAEDLIKK
jgi:hypothetical protein